MSSPPSPHPPPIPHHLWSHLKWPFKDLADDFYDVNWLRYVWNQLFSKKSLFFKIIVAFICLSILKAVFILHVSGSWKLSSLMKYFCEETFSNLAIILVDDEDLLIEDIWAASSKNLKRESRKRFRNKISIWEKLGQNSL